MYKEELSNASTCFWKETKDSIIAASPAKINVFLHVLGRREDLYHDIQTCYVLIDWFDTLVVSRGKKNTGATQDRIHAKGRYAGQLPPADSPEHLLNRTIALLRRRAPERAFAVDIEITKNIPVASGLGGASANAATLLLMLNRLWNLQLTREQLVELGVILGADVPLFIHGRHAFAEGIGERITPMSNPPAAFYLLIYPGIDCPTAEQFSRLTPQDYSERLDINRIEQAGTDFWLEQEYHKYHNVFLAPLLKRNEQMRLLYDTVVQKTPNKLGERIFLSGSGCTLFVAYQSAVEMQQDEEYLKKIFTKNVPAIRACKALNIQAQGKLE